MADESVTLVMEGRRAWLMIGERKLNAYSCSKPPLVEAAEYLLSIGAISEERAESLTEEIEEAPDLQEDGDHKGSIMKELHYIFKDIDAHILEGDSGAVEARLKKLGFFD